eukprot:TRINITY_DN2781_c0_g2_i1.p1 TRINITY_DN2781_c0_g2~~TRINITY_DN2781_c0_g2_i1.p1  ORF type:complete len:369 (-),score=67.82 TRINITY_DN2781_c0_g2_i1:26-1132(-)
MWLLLLFFASIFGQKTSLEGQYSQALKGQLVSADDLYYVTGSSYRSTGLVINQYPSFPKWSSGTISDQSTLGSWVYVMQSDGNLVYYNITSSLNIANYRISSSVAVSLHLDANGTLILSGNGQTKWTSIGSTTIQPDSLNKSSTLDYRTKMALYSWMEPSTISNGPFTLRLLNDSISVTNDDENTTIWSYGVSNRNSDPYMCMVGSDGGWYYYSLAKLWESNTTNLEDQYNSLQFITNNGILGIVSTNGTIMWRSDQYVRPIYTTATSTSSSTSQTTSQTRTSQSTSWTYVSSYWYPPTPTWGYTWGSWGGSSWGNVQQNKWGSTPSLNKMMAIIVSVTTVFGFIALVLIIVIGVIMIRRTKNVALKE